jgi:hypothetical protein
MHHAEDAFVFFDPVFAPLVEELARRLPLVRSWIALSERDALPKMKLDGLLAYEDLLAGASPDYEWPLLDENTASTLCYTLWQLPDDVVFVDALPHTATGKLLKTELRQRFHGHLAVSA